MRNRAAYPPIEAFPAIFAAMCRFAASTTLGAALLAVGSADSAFAQPAAAAPAEEPAAEAREMSVTTDDGVAIKFSYYPSAIEESVPVILLHGGGGSRDDLKSVAQYLQAQGRSVVLPDLRGHGDSTQQTKGGNTIALSYKTQNRNDVAAMVYHDMTKLWNFLLNENNDKVVNVKKLCVVGVDMGAVVALNFVAKNYMEKDYRNQPRGKDVKALVLVSPPTAYRGASYTEAVRQPAFKGEISSLVVVGDEGASQRRAAQQLENMLTKFAESGAAKNGKDKLVLYGAPKTKLQGAELLANPQLKLSGAVDGFIKTRLADKNIPWQKQIAF